MVQNVSHLLQDSVTLELECIDRLYLNAYVPQLQTPGAIAGFIKNHLGAKYVSTVMLAPLTQSFIRRIEAYASNRGIDLITFTKDQRKDDIAKKYLSRFKKNEGVLFIGKAQEKASVARTEKRRDKNGAYSWIVRQTAMVNQYYFYIVDRDCGPMFIKFCSYFPFTAKVYLNGHEWLKRQLKKRGIRFQPLDNGILSCKNAEEAQKIANRLTPREIERIIHKWFSRLPHPYSQKDREVGCRYDISVLQAEFALTQVLDRPKTGRQFFEQIIRENLDLGRPDQVQLIFDRKVIRTTPGTFRTRVITRGVTPSLHVQYKSSRIKQYHKEGRALRTETTINNTREFNIGKRIKNLQELREVGFNANRRLLDVQALTHDCRLGQEQFESLHQSRAEKNQRASALKFGCPRVMALMYTLIVFCHHFRGFSNKDLRELTAPLLDLDPAQIKPGRMTYDLRRLRIHGLIQKIPRTHRYQVTQLGFRSALFYTRVYGRVFRTAFSLPQLDTSHPEHVPGMPSSMKKLVESLDRFIKETQLYAA